MKEREYRRGNLGGAILVLLGVLFLLANFGYLTPAAFVALARYWPVLLIIIGLDLLFRGTTRGFLGPILILSLVVALVFSAVGSGRGGRWSWSWRSGGTEAWPDLIPGAGRGESQEPLRHPVREARFKLSFGGVALQLHPLAEQNLLYKLDWRSGGADRVLARTTWTADRATVRLYQPHRFVQQLHGSTWDLALPAGLPLDLEVDGGGGRTNLDCSALTLRNLELNLGAGDVEVRLGGRSGRQQVRLSAGAANVVVLVPRGAGVRVESRGLLVRDQLERAGLKAENGAYVNDAWGKAAAQIAVEVTAGAGRLAVETY